MNMTALFSSSVESVRSPWKARADELMMYHAQRWARLSAQPMVLFGAGKTGKEMCSVLLAAGIKPVCFVDDTPSKQGSFIDDVPVVSLSQLESVAGKTPTVVVCIFHPQHPIAVAEKKILAQLPTAHTVAFYSVLMALKGEAFSHYFFTSPRNECEQLAAYEVLYRALVDEVSKAVLDAHLVLRLWHEGEVPVSDRSEVPMPVELISNDGLTYVDGGAFDGDTLSIFVNQSAGRFHRAYALEPDTENAAKLMHTVAQLPDHVRAKVILVTKGVWQESGEIGFVSEGDMSAGIQATADTKIAVTSLDDLLSGEQSPIYIKLDVEGVEMASLRGAAQVTIRCRPVWAIAVYHMPRDLLEVFHWLESMQQGYRYQLRCYGAEGTDLMLFAW